ncbi:MAG: DUF6249 domain-containing protein [Caulobacteraceae bacterium]
MVGDLTGMVAMLAFWAFLAAVIIVPTYLRHRDRTQMQETLRIALDKGANLPPELVTALQSSVTVRAMPTREGDLRRAIVLIAVGLGIVLLGFGLWYGLMSVSDDGAYITGGSVAGAGAIPMMIGVAYLILWATGANKSKSVTTSQS